jgi:hypothetical protein
VIEERREVFDPREKPVSLIRPEARGAVTSNETLLERGKQHGNAHRQFALAQEIKETLRSGANWDALTVQQRETLEMLATKLSRILEGDATFLEHWRDLWGYSELQTLMMEGKTV